ncbi:MAG: T9SS type A sorting domain-containing protein [Ferruginibacter sp.]
MINPNISGNSYLEIWGSPFTQSTKIIYKTDGGHTLLQIFDTMGRLIKIPVDAELLAGTYSYTFESGPLPAGVYYARLQNGSIQQVKAMVKVR